MVWYIDCINLHLLYIFLEFLPNQPNLAIQTHHNSIVHRLHKSSFAMYLSEILKTLVYMFKGFPFYLVLKTGPRFGEAHSQNALEKSLLLLPVQRITVSQPAKKHINIFYILIAFPTPVPVAAI